jgi:hypothetical protein
MTGLGALAAASGAFGVSAAGGAAGGAAFSRCAQPTVRRASKMASILHAEFVLKPIPIDSACMIKPLFLEFVI